jgi:acyl carrier protein
MADARSEIRSFVVTNFLFGDDPLSLKNDASFLDGGIIDSTGVLELVGFLERQYQIAIADHELIPDNLDSVDQAAAFVGRKLVTRGELQVVGE